MPRQKSRKNGQSRRNIAQQSPAEPAKYVADQAYHRASARHAIHSQRRGFTGQQEVEHDAALEDIASDPHKTADLTLTYQIAETLERHYPAHPWMVTVSHAQGVAMIKLPLLMKRAEQYVLHISALKNDPGHKLVVRAGGELLERFKMPRGGFSLTPFLEAKDRNAQRRRRLLVPDRSKIVSKLRADGAPAIVVPDFETSARPRA